MFARFDENPAMTLRVIKETKRYGRTDGRTHGQRENSIPPTNKVCGGYNYFIFIGYLRMGGGPPLDSPLIYIDNLLMLRRCFVVILLHFSVIIKSCDNILSVFFHYVFNFNNVFILIYILSVW